MCHRVPGTTEKRAAFHDSQMIPNNLLHQPFYCEENVFHLCQHPFWGERSRHAVFVTGPLGGCFMWHQKARNHPNAPIFWDYHVFVVAEDPWEVWDLDSTLGCPVSALKYFIHSFRKGLPPAVSPIFRFVSPNDLATHFRSDRSHMKDETGDYTRPPPPWPEVSAKGLGSNLMRFVDMKDPFIGRVMSLSEVLLRVSPL
jgi:protein N-terminal glutamine amidohydrolase